MLTTNARNATGTHRTNTPTQTNKTTTLFCITRQPTNAVQRTKCSVTAQQCSAQSLVHSALLRQPQRHITSTPQRFSAATFPAKRTRCVEPKPFTVHSERPDNNAHATQRNAT